MFVPLQSQCSPKAQIISNWFLEHDNELTVLKWPLQTTELNSTEDLWDMVKQELWIMSVQLTNLQKWAETI